MEVRCEDCAGCCIDWRPLVPDAERDDHERRGPHAPLDDTYNLVPLTRDEVRALLEAGLADALTPRLWAADGDEGDDGVEIDGHRVAAVRGRPTFFVGIRKPPKPIAPFDRDEEAWLPTCTFLDPTTLQCRIHGDDIYPAECADYPAHNLALEVDAECERVERATGERRLFEDGEAPGGAARVNPDDVDGMLLGPQAIGQKVFVHPRPDDLAGAVDRVARGEATPEDRAEFVAVAAASSPGTVAVSDYHYEEAVETALAADSWAGRAIDEWERRASGGEAGASAPSAAVAERVEDERGAPGTPGWE